jgi:hypothetical protein
MMGNETTFERDMDTVRKPTLDDLKCSADRSLYLLANEVRGTAHIANVRLYITTLENRVADLERDIDVIREDPIGAGIDCCEIAREASR